MCKIFSKILKFIYICWSISKAGRHNKSHQMTPRANIGLSVKCDESDDTYFEVQECSPAKAIVIPNMDTESKH